MGLIITMIYNEADFGGDLDTKSPVIHDPHIIFWHSSAKDNFGDKIVEATYWILNFSIAFLYK